MIDCFTSDVIGIKTVFDFPEIRNCHRDFFRALSGHVRNVSDSAFRKTVVDYLINLVRAKTMPKFTEV